VRVSIDKTVIYQRRVEKSDFEDHSEEIQCEYWNERICWEYSAN